MKCVEITHTKGPTRHIFHEATQPRGPISQAKYASIVQVFRTLLIGCWDEKDVRTALEPNPKVELGNEFRLTSGYDIPLHS